MKGTVNGRKNLGRFGHILGSRQFSLGVYNNGPLFSFSFSLFGNGSFHIRRQANILQFHIAHFKPPGIRFFIDYLPYSFSQLFSINQELIDVWAYWEMAYWKFSTSNMAFSADWTL